MILLRNSKKIIITIILILIIFNLAGCGNKNKNEKLQKKVATELEYVNVKIIDLLNALNNLSFENYTISTEKVKLDDNTDKKENEQGSDSKSKMGEEGSGSQAQGETQSNSQTQENGSQDLINTTEMITDATLMKDKNNINWDLIKPEIELLNESWNVIVLDLYTLNVKNDVILDFSNKLNKCIVAIKNEDKAQSLKTLANLYSSIPVFLKEIKDDENTQKIRQTQSYVINAYSLAEDMGNTEIRNNITKAIETYSEIMSDVNYTKDHSYKVNKIYVLLNELLNSLDEKDSDVFYIKYKVFMEAVNNW